MKACSRWLALVAVALAVTSSLGACDAGPAPTPTCSREDGSTSWLPICGPSGEWVPSCAAVCVATADEPLCLTAPSDGTLRCVPR